MRVQISDRHELEVAIGALQEKVLAVPSRGDRGSIIGLLLEQIDLFLEGVDVVSGSASGCGGGIWLDRVGNSVGLDEVSASGLGLSARLDETLDLRLEFRHLAAQLLYFFLGSSLLRCGIGGGFGALSKGERTGNDEKRG